MYFLQSNVTTVITRNGLFIKIHSFNCRFIFYLMCCHFILLSLISSIFHGSSNKVSVTIKNIIAFVAFLKISSNILVCVILDLFSINNRVVVQLRISISLLWSNIYSWLYICLLLYYLLSDLFHQYLIYILGYLSGLFLAPQL